MSPAAKSKDEFGRVRAHLASLDDPRNKSTHVHGKYFRKCGQRVEAGPVSQR